MAQVMAARGALTYAAPMSDEKRPTTIPPTGEVVTDPQIALAEVSKLLDRALRALGDAGEKEPASEFAARAWTLLRHSWPREGQRFDGTLHYLSRTIKAPIKVTGEAPDLDVRHMPPAQRHETIFKEWFALKPGEAYMLVNDHDPKPLYYQFAAEHPGSFSWDEIEMGPEVWRVRIGRTA